MYNWDFYTNIEEVHPISDANNLYAGFDKVKKGSGWKQEVQRFRWNKAEEVLKLQKDLENFRKTGKGYELQEYSRFTVSERGHKRPITALRVRDRIVKHVLNDLYLIPHIRPKLIYDNGASLKDKGVDFTRRRLVAHLESFYREYGTNDGYIRLSDFSGFYDNIDHELAFEMIKKYEHDEFALRLVKQAYDSFKIDVSFLSDSDYEKAKHSKINIMKYREHGGLEEHRKLKMLNKSLSVGDQTSQITAISFPTDIDKMMTIVCGQKYYARYMDDTYLIHRDKNQVKLLGEVFDNTSRKYKLFVSDKKTQICKISKPFIFLQYRYYLRENGHVVVRIGKKTVIRMRRKLRKMKDIATPERVEEMFRSWICGYRKVMSKFQIKNIIKLYRELYGEGLDIWMEQRCLI